MQQISLTSAASSCLWQRRKVAVTYMWYVLGGREYLWLQKLWLECRASPGEPLCAPWYCSCALLSAHPCMPGMNICTAQILYLVSPNTCSCNFESYFLPLFVPVKLGDVNVYGRQTGERARTWLRGIHLGKNPDQIFRQLYAGFP